MHKQLGWTYSLILLAVLTSCYEKNAKRSGELIPDMYSPEVVEDDGEDTLQFVDTFQLITVSEIYTDLKPLLRSKLKIVYPKPDHADSLGTYNAVEWMALSVTHAEWADEVANAATVKQATEDVNTQLNNILTDSLQTDLNRVDSFQLNVSELLKEDSLTNEAVYFEAVVWLENLYITLESYATVRNKKKFEILVLMQLENGEEMLDRLYYYQDYVPIANFSQRLLEILDCRHYTFDVTQLKSEVIALRNFMFEPEQSDN